MKSNRTYICVVSLALIIVGWVIWRQRGVTLTPAEAQFRAVFLRPKALSEKSKNFSIQFNGQDALTNVVKVESGHKVEVVARFPPLASADENRSQWIQIVPRLVSQGDDAFQWFDTRTECFVNWSGSSQNDPFQEWPPKSSIRFDLRPGEYRLRYYLQVQYLHPELGLPEKYLLAESRLTVIGDPQSGVLPLNDPKNKFPVESE